MILLLSYYQVLLYSGGVLFSSGCVALGCSIVCLSDFEEQCAEDNSWTVRSKQWQMKGVRSVGRPKRHWRDDIVGQQGAVWTRIAKDKDVGLLRRATSCSERTQPRIK